VYGIFEFPKNQPLSPNLNFRGKAKKNKNPQSFRIPAPTKISFFNLPFIIGRKMKNLFWKENEKSFEIFWNILFLKWNLSNFNLFVLLGSPHVLIQYKFGDFFFLNSKSSQVYYTRKTKNSPISC
jgi:hypothetical protein